MRKSTISKTTVLELAILENDLNLDPFKKGLQNLKNNDFRNDIVSKGFEQSLKFSWDKCCAETYEFYKDVYND